jgi:hypothetical protein
MSSLRSEALADVNEETAVFWQVMQCSLVDGFQRFGAKFCLSLQVLARRHIPKDFRLTCLVTF